MSTIYYNNTIRYITLFVDTETNLVELTIVGHDVEDYEPIGATIGIVQ